MPTMGFGQVNMALRRRGQTWRLDIATPGGHRLRRSAETTDRKAAQALHDELKAELWRQAKLGDKPKYTWEDAVLRWLNEQANKASKRLNATVYTAWRNAPKKTGIENFRFHDTRHTWASLLIQNGVPKGMIKEMGGWKSDSMVERYAHLAPQHLTRHAAVIDDLLRPRSERAPLAVAKTPKRD